MSTVQPSPWPPPTDTPVGTTGWYLASDGEWYRSDRPPAAGFSLSADGRWVPDPDNAWRSARWGLGDVWWGVLAYLVTSIAAGLLVAVVVVAAQGGSIETVEFGVYAISALVLVNVLVFGGVPWIASRRKGQGSLAADFGLRFRPIDLVIGLGFGFGGLIAAGIAGTLVDQAFGVEEQTSNIPVDRLDGVAQFLVFFVAVAVVTPIIEELFFRGLLYRSFLKRGTSAVAAVAMTTLVFVVPHLSAADSWASFTSLAVSIGVLGLAFNLAALVTGRLGAAIVAHLVVNGTAVLVLWL